MAGAIICDRCGVACLPARCRHVRIHKFANATEHYVAAISSYDICSVYYDKFKDFIGGDDDAITGHNEATTEC